MRGVGGVGGLGIFGRVFWGTVAVILLTAAGVYLAAVPIIENSLEEEALGRVEREALWAAELCAQAYSVEEGRFDLEGFEAIAGVGSRFTLVLPDGRVLYDSHQTAEEMDNHGSRAEILHPGTAVTRFSRTLGQAMTYFALPVVVQGESRGTSRVSVPVEDRETRLAGLRSAIRNGALLAAVVSLVLAWFFARRVARPLGEIAELVGELGATRTTRRLAPRSDDEIGRLARAVNRMADDLQFQLAHIERDRVVREAILKALAGGLLAVDSERRILFINEQARRMLGAPEGLLAGRGIWELTRNSTLAEVVARCLSTSKPAGAETEVEIEGVRYVVEIAAVPLGGEPLGQPGCVLELRDVSDLRRLEAVRRDFVSNVSHELKTPLTAMRGYTEALLEAEDMPADTRRAFLRKAHRNTERLSAIVSDLLSLSRIESQENELNFEALDLTELVRTVMGDLSDLAQSRRAQLSFEAEDRALEVWADAEALGMALSNLISNALQYSPEGAEVRISASSNGDEVWVDVCDSGPGIPQAHHERIFERFYRIDKARSRKLGGTGLGLAIVRHVMAAHGGRVELESELNRGSCFRLVLPARHGPSDISRA